MELVYSARSGTGANLDTGVSLLFGVDGDCRAPPFNDFSDVGNFACVDPLPDFLLKYWVYLDYPENGNRNLKRLVTSLLPPREVWEWVVVASNVNHSEPLRLNFEWDSIPIPRNVDLRLLPPGGGELDMLARSSFTVELPPSFSSARFTIRATSLLEP